MTNETTLTYQVYVAPIIAMAGKDVPPGQSRSTWSPISATLICGRNDAVLVDPLMTVEQGMAVADWVSTTGKNLTTVYVTHGHGDHSVGLGAVRRRSSHGRPAGGAPPEPTTPAGGAAAAAANNRHGTEAPPRITENTRQYISGFDRLDKETATAEELYWQMLAIHPHRVNPGALWLSAQSAKA